jgi:hypothetical protein
MACQTLPATSYSILETSRRSSSGVKRLILAGDSSGGLVALGHRFF